MSYKLLHCHRVSGSPSVYSPSNFASGVAMMTEAQDMGGFEFHACASMPKAISLAPLVIQLHSGQFTTEGQRSQSRIGLGPGCWPNMNWLSLLTPLTWWACPKKPSSCSCGWLFEAFVDCTTTIQLTGRIQTDVYLTYLGSALILQGPYDLGVILTCGDTVHNVPAAL